MFCNVHFWIKSKVTFACNKPCYLFCHKTAHATLLNLIGPVFFHDEINREETVECVPGKLASGKISPQNKQEKVKKLI